MFEICLDLVDICLDLVEICLDLFEICFPKSLDLFHFFLNIVSDLCSKITIFNTLFGQV